MEERRVTGVQIFRLSVGGQTPAPECDDCATRVGYREHQATAEGIIGLAALVAFFGEARFENFRHREALRLQVFDCLAPVIGRISQPVAPPGTRQKTTPFQIEPRGRPFSRLQAILVIAGRRFAHRLQALAVIILLGRLGAGLGQAHPRFFGKLLDRLHE